jgi:cysteine desulfurase
MTGAARVYLDHAATSPIRPEVRRAVGDALAIIGNPSSVHAEGRAARALLEAARRRIRAAIGAADAGALIFTSGATEANATALFGGGLTLASAVEHPSVLAQPDVATLPVDAVGRLDLEALERRLAAGDVARVAVMLANNETGVVQPVAEAARLVHAADALLHVDAVQALGKRPIDAVALGCDSLAFSAHKIGGLPGTGALWLRDPDRLVPLLRGGGQEQRRRAGSEGLVGILAFAAAVEAIAADEAERLAALQAGLERRVAAIAGEPAIMAGTAERLPHISGIALPGVAAMTQVMVLDLAGIAVSAGAACSSGKVARSHVLEAMALAPEIADGCIRVSLGWGTMPADIDCFLQAWEPLARRRRAAA